MWRRPPQIFLDPRQTINRGVQINGVSGSTGGTFIVRGYDMYHQPMSQTVTVAAGANVGYSTKTFGYILSVTPNFTDVSHNYTVGTSDLFGLMYYAPVWDDLEVSWASANMTSSTGFLAGVTATPTATTGDVRGTNRFPRPGRPATTSRAAQAMARSAASR